MKTMVPGGLCKQHQLYKPYLERLTKIYAAMDQQYALAAEYYGFNCTGCNDNCCSTCFYHHTFLEYLFILKGYDTLVSGQRTEIKKRARRVCGKTQAADENAIKIRQMCPLNLEGRCILYAYRPMICRLHGIDHEFRKPDQKVVYGPGCKVFMKQCEEKKYFKFDRTPFYLAMAGLEKELKLILGFADKIKMTVAEMIVTF
jgi:Fe-S-cluster containining protein